LGGREDFFLFSFVPNMFPSCFQWVPIRFPICSLVFQCVPQWCSQYHLALIPYVSSKVLLLTYLCGPKGYVSSKVLLLKYLCGPKGEAFHLSIESSILGEPPYFQLFFCHGPIKLAHCKRKKVGLVMHPN
jgi:hypothetical protein